MVQLPWQLVCSLHPLFKRIPAAATPTAAQNCSPDSAFVSQINILHLSSYYSHSIFPVPLLTFAWKTSRFHSCQVALCAQVIKVGADDVRSGLIEEGMRVLGLRCALPDSNGSEHGLGWLRRVSYPGHSKLPTITKVKTGCNNPLQLLLSHQESGLHFEKTSAKNLRCHCSSVPMGCCCWTTTFNKKTFQDIFPKRFLGVNDEWD